MVEICTNYRIDSEHDGPDLQRSLRVIEAAEVKQMIDVSCLLRDDVTNAFT